MVDVRQLRKGHQNPDLKYQWPAASCEPERWPMHGSSQPQVEAISGSLQMPKPSQCRPNSAIGSTWRLAITALLLAQPVASIHHFRHAPVHNVLRRDSDIPLRIRNQCNEDIWPAILTQFGQGPSHTGFHLASGNSTELTVGQDWQGRVWARTNCTFDEDGKVLPSSQGQVTCSTGDCGQFLECQGAGQPPATLAEFTLSGHQYQTFYDISLVDGYNIPVGIIFLANETRNSNLSDIPPNLTNPICIASPSLLEPSGSTTDADFGSNDSFPIPLEQAMSHNFVRSWCPFPLLALPPQKPGDGIYPYPDDNIQRPEFSPCYSACARWNLDRYCCAGSHDQPDSCKPSYYSTQAKKVCPDAYSYAYDDHDSTFIIPQGGGFEVVFCPKGRSSTILRTLGDQMHALAGGVNEEILARAGDVEYIEERNDGSLTVELPLSTGSSFALVILLGWLCLW